MLNLVPFTDVGSNFDAKLSVRPNGTVGVSSGALKRFKLLDEDSYIVMHYDKEAQIVGVKPTRDKSVPGATKLIIRYPRENSQQKQPSGHFSAKAFLQFHDIPYKGQRTQSFDAEWSDEYDMILFDLGKPRDVSRGKKEISEPLADAPEKLAPSQPEPLAPPAIHSEPQPPRIQDNEPF